MASNIIVQIIQTGRVSCGEKCQYSTQKAVVCEKRSSKADGVT